MEDSDGRACHTQSNIMAGRCGCGGLVLAWRLLTCARKWQTPLVDLLVHAILFFIDDTNLVPVVNHCESL
jgi:hypothetical protein